MSLMAIDNRHLPAGKEPQLTLQSINKTLNQWMNRQEKSELFYDSNIFITKALDLAFGLLVDMFEGGDEKYKFQDVLKTYMGLFLSTGNNQHRYLVELHLKKLLEADRENYQRYRRNQKFYLFLCKIFYYYPFLVFRMLQSKYSRVFSVESKQVIELYGLYIKFANTRKNEKLLEEYIQVEIKASNGSLEKLNILLRSYNSAYRKLIKPHILRQLIDIIIRRNHNWLSEREDQRDRILNFCQTMYVITWPKEMQDAKPDFTVQMVKVWERSTLTVDQKKTLNRILETISVAPTVETDLKSLIRGKIAERSHDQQNFGLNSEFARIIISKFSQEQTESIVSHQQFKQMIDEIIEHPSTCEEKLELLEVIRAKGIFKLGTYIEARLTDMIRGRFTGLAQYGAWVGRGEGVGQLVFTLKMIRLYNFEKFDLIYSLFKQYVLKSKFSRQYQLEARREILLVCLFILRDKTIKSTSILQESQRAFRDIIQLIGQEIELKIMMIQYIVDHLSERFYQGQIYSIYRECKYECLLYEDYTTNDMAIKIFSIKTICYLANDAHSEYTFFLKNAYYQLYDRLSIKNLIAPEEKEITLKLIREVMRHRAELFEGEADALSGLLIGELHRSIQFHSPQTNAISIIIFKILQALLRKIPLKMISYAKAVGHYIVSILNFKILKKELKKIALETFCDMVYNCNYVILPYFHFPHLYLILREVLRSDDHYYYYLTDLLRLIGRLGYINEENFVGLQLVNQRNLRVDENFEGAFKEITFIKNIKDKKYSLLEAKNLLIEDAFYSEEKTTKACIQIENYRFYILDKIVKNISEGSLQVKITKTLNAIRNIIPVLTAQDDQRLLHEFLLARLFEIEPRFSGETLNIILELLCYHQLQQTHCKAILGFYLPRIHNNRRELDLIKLLCVITDKYRDYLEDKLIEIIIVVKRIVMEFASRQEKEESKIKLCFSVFINLADKIDHLLHLFFIDLNKAFSNNQDKDKNDKNNEFARIPNALSSDFFTLIIHLTKKCPSIQYFLPSIRQCLLDYLNRETQLLRKQANQSQQNLSSSSSSSSSFFNHISVSSSPRPQSNKFLDKIINTMICLMVIYGKRCESFITILEWNIKAHNIYNIFYRISLDYFKKHSNLDFLHCAFTDNQLNELFYNDIKTFHFEKRYKEPLPVNANVKILREFERLSIEQNHTEEQEDLWMDNLSIELFSHSNEPILRACIDFVSYDKQFAYDIFDVPFYFFWKNLTTEEQARMTMKIKNILMNKSISLRIRQKLLDAIYFVERCQIPFIMKDKLLSDVAVEVEDQVKALFYLEREYENDPEIYREYLIEMYAQIGERESVIGLLKCFNVAGSTNTKLYIKLSRRFAQRSQDFLREFDNLKENKEGSGRRDRFEKGEKVILQLDFKKDTFNWDGIIKDVGVVAPANRSKFAHYAIQAAINLGNWEEVKRWVPQLQEESSSEEVSLWKIMIQIHDKKYRDAQKLIVDIREKIYYKIRQMFNFSYEKSMKGVLLLQQISELEEILELNRCMPIKEMQQRSEHSQAALKKKQLMTVWNDRFEGLKKNIISIQKILFVRGLLLTKTQNIDNWITFCKLALSENKKVLGKNIYNILNGLNIKDQIKLLELKFIHYQIQVKDCMTTYFDALVEIQTIINDKKLTEDKKSIPLIFEIYYRYAQGVIQSEDMTKEQGKKLIQILDKFLKEKNYCEYYELSHIMGLTHIKVLQIYNTEGTNKKTKTDKKVNISKDEENDSFRREQKSLGDQRKTHLEEALRCFLNSVTNSTRQNKYFLEDCLKILNLISMGSEGPTLIDIFQSKYTKIPSQGLIEFIPQIIARLDNNYGQNEKYINILKQLLIFIGIDHPQALLFPLIFLRKGNNQFKRKHAVQIYEKIIEQRIQFQALYEEGSIIVDQLCKISLKLSEKVFIFMTKILKILKENNSKNIKMLISERIIEFSKKILQQNEMLSSQSEFGFIQQEKQTLIMVVQYLTIYKELQEIFYFNEAIRMIRQVVGETDETLKFIKMIYLEEASVKLSKIKKSAVCLFGNYTPNINNVTIDSFKNEIQIIISKQRPKKFVIIGTDNKQYNYLLKGKQDLRLDERIMQLFSFINKMFHSPTEKQNYEIQGYSITPINFEIGIISWVENCDTIGDLIFEYRKNNGMAKNIKEASNLQYNICNQICPTYGTLTKYQKVQIFKEIQKILSGNDLKNILWRRSVTSEKWLKSRSCFTRSLAVMSIVGYIIGLGDRHPFNIMMHRDTGKIIHIDFGDCFQVTKMKNLYPEKVPFRLTRMLVNAMEACKTDGIFKQTCEKIMKILRNNKESILVIIEAFRYDPLIGWKITSKEDKQDQIMVETSEYQLLQTFEEKSKTKNSEKQSESTKHILNNIKNKLNGMYQKKPLSEEQHVDKLIKQATSPLNLVQHWKGWLIYW